MKFKSLLLSLLLIGVFGLNAADRVAVFPFYNMDGNLDYEMWSYDLQDSLAKKLALDDPDELNYRIVPVDSVEIILAEFNLDPTNPEYESDMWKAAEALNVKRVVSGDFIKQSGKFVVNAFVYDVHLKLPHPQYQAKNLFKPEERLYSVIPIIAKRLRQAVIGN